LYAELFERQGLVTTVAATALFNSESQATCCVVVNVIKETVLVFG